MRGSVSFSNWVADIKYAQTECAVLGHPKARCEVGFYGFWTESKDAGAVTAVQKAKAENPSYSIVVTGHSLGAAAAVFGAAELRKVYPDVWLVSENKIKIKNDSP
jgi:Lipase (class 3)